MLGSALWAAPVAADRWFDQERLDRSRAYHRPIARSAMIRVGLQALGLVVAWLLLRRLGSQNAASSTNAMLASGAAVGAAFWLPHLLVDAWIEYRHEPRFGRCSAPFGSFVLVSLFGTVGVLGVGAVLALVVQRVSAATVWWPLVLWALLVVVMGGVGPVAARRADHSTRLDPVVEAELQLVADAGGVPHVTWGRLGSAKEMGINAASIGGIGTPRVLCSDALVAADPELRNFVVAHEIGHLARHHHGRAFAVSLVGVAFELASLWTVDHMALGRIGGGVSDPRNWPLAVAVLVVAAVLTEVVESWLSRMHERQADLAAVETVGALGAPTLRALHDHGRSDLDPGVLRRVFAPHPPPAERLASAERSVRCGVQAPNTA